MLQHTALSNDTVYEVAGRLLRYAKELRCSRTAVVVPAQWRCAQLYCVARLCISTESIGDRVIATTTQS